MLLFTFKRARPANLVLGLLSVLAFAVSPSLTAAEPWQISRFEVVNVEPAGVIEDHEYLEIMELMARAMRAANFDPDFPGIFETVALAPELKQEIEQILQTSAMQLQSWGFPEPALEPVVTLPNGARAYRVYLVTGRKDYAGIYHASLCGEVFRGETAMLLNADSILDDGKLDDWGVQTVVHELFHASQFATNFEQSCQQGWTGSWMTEGQARAVGVHLAERFRPSGMRVLLSSLDKRDRAWGKRNYSNMLPYAYQDPIRPAYQSNSFWQFLAQYQAAGGEISEPTAMFPHRDFSYLAAMLEAEPELLDCRTKRDPCTRELAWVDAQVRRTLGKPLHDLYARFMSSYALYGSGRLRGEVRMDPRWLKGSFDNDCPYVKLEDTTEGFQSTTVIPFFDIAAAQCWRLDVQGFDQDEVRLLVMASPAGENNPLALEQLSALVADGGTQRRRGELSGSPANAARWEFTLPVGKETPVLLTNMANEAGNTRVMRNLAVEFVVLREYARMASGSGPSGADIDQALPIELDRFSGYVFPSGFEERDGQYIGVIDETEGLVDPCLIRFPMLNSTTQDAVSIQMNSSGPLAPGEYQLADGAGFKEPNEVPGQFLATFRIGHGNPLSGGRITDYFVRSGSIRINSVAGGLVRGVMTANGEAVPTVYGQPKPNHQQVSIATEFSVLVGRTMGLPYSDEPYACLAQERRVAVTGESEVPPTGVPPQDPEPPVIEPEDEPPPQYTQQWIEIDSVVDGEPGRDVFGDDELRLGGGCSGNYPLNFGFSIGTPAEGNWRYLSFTTEDEIEAGALGSFALSELKFEPEVARPEGLPPDSPIRMPVRFSGTGTLTLDQHDTAPSNRRLSGTVEGNVVHGATGRQATVSARFSVPFSCG